MIIEFSVSNFRSIKETIEFSFQADSSKNHSDNFFDVPLDGGKSIRLLKTAAIYGANASGKSNILKALDTFCQLILNSTDFKNGENIPDTYYNPFLLDTQNRVSPVHFKIAFIAKDSIRYDYEIKYDEQNIVFERLDFYPEGNKNLLFERTREQGDVSIKYGRRFKQADAPKRLIANRLYLSVLGNLPHEQVENIYLYFRSLAIGNVLDQDTITDWFNKVKRKANLDEAFKQQLEKLMRSADTKIETVSIIKDMDAKPWLEVNIPDNASERVKNAALLFKENNEKLRPLSVKATYGLYENGIRISGTDAIKWTDQSAGTKLLFSIGGMILIKLQEGGTMVIDEFDSSLHTDLCGFLLDLFHYLDSNTTNAQLLFATHDVNLMGNERFRKDQLWFTEKNKFGATELFSAQDFSDVRDTTPLDKWYINGKFGGKPKIKETDLIFS
jgi:AAA15 family ATPase/GTPase